MIKFGKGLNVILDELVVGRDHLLTVQSLSYLVNKNSAKSVLEAVKCVAKDFSSVEDGL